MRAARQRQIAMIFRADVIAQPVLTIGSRVVRGLLLARAAHPRPGWRTAVACCVRVSISGPTSSPEAYPPHPSFRRLRHRAIESRWRSPASARLIADEPTHALDATIHAQILAIISGASAEAWHAVILITHPLPRRRRRDCARVLVMYGAQVEEASVATCSRDSAHPLDPAFFCSIRVLSLFRGVRAGGRAAAGFPACVPSLSPCRPASCSDARWRFRAGSLPRPAPVSRRNVARPWAACWRLGELCRAKP